MSEKIKQELSKFLKEHEEDYSNRDDFMENLAGYFYRLSLNEVKEDIEKMIAELNIVPNQENEIDDSNRDNYMQILVGYYSKLSLNEIREDLMVERSNNVPKQEKISLNKTIKRIQGIELFKILLSVVKNKLIKSSADPYYIKDRGIFIPGVNKILAMEDSCDGEICQFSEALKQNAPTDEEWDIILVFKDEINQLLKDNGGVPLKDSWFYWSSTKFSETLVWGVSPVYEPSELFGISKNHLYARALSAL